MNLILENLGGKELNEICIFLKSLTSVFGTGNALKGENRKDTEKF